MKRRVEVLEPEDARTTVLESGGMLLPEVDQ
jgi:hypothetical protein